MLSTLSTLFVLTSVLVTGQRPPFAGSRPIGFPELVNRTTTPVPGGLGDRFGEGTTQKLPIQANGDRDLIDRLSKLPIDKQPFWFINWQAVEEDLKKPQSYPQRPNVFVDSIQQSNNGGSVSSQQFSSNQGSTTQGNQFVVANQGFPAQGPVVGIQEFANQGVPNNQGFSSNNQGFSNNNPGFASGQGFSTNGQVISNNNPVLANSQGFPSGQGFSNGQVVSSFNSFPNAQTSSQNNNRFVNSNNGLSNPNQGFSNSINGFVLTDPALVYTNTESNSGTQNNDNVKGNSNQVFASTSSRPSSNQQIFKIPNHGLTTLHHGFPNQNPGLVTPSITAPNKGFSSTSTGFASNVDVSNSKPGINSRFSAQAASQSTMTSNNYKVGDSHNYSYHWNNSFNHKYDFAYNYTTHTVPMPLGPRPDNINHEQHNLH